MAVRATSSKKTSRYLPRVRNELPQRQIGWSFMNMAIITLEPIKLPQQELVRPWCQASDLITSPPQVRNKLLRVT